MTGVEEFMYTGKMMDAVTGLYYFGARLYDDAIGRFTSEDMDAKGQMQRATKLEAEHS